MRLASFASFALLVACPGRVGVGAPAIRDAGLIDLDGGCATGAECASGFCGNGACASNDCPHGTGCSGDTVCFDQGPCGSECRRPLEEGDLCSLFPAGSCGATGACPGNDICESASDHGDGTPLVCHHLASSEGEGEGTEAAEGEGSGAAEGEGEGEGEGESEPGECDDGIDNDADFLIDAADPGCRQNIVEAVDNQCANGVDDDYDGLIDENDPDCATGIESSGQLPDLVLRPEFTDTFTFSTVEVAPGDPELLEDCWHATGARRKMGFSSVVANLGTSAFDYESPEAHPGVFTPTAFGDNRMQGWLSFTLLDGGGNIVAYGHKAAFCLIDGVHIDPSSACQSGLGHGPGCLQHNCSGIDVGWADEYEPVSDPCQFVDVTGVPPGDYTLHQEVNVQGDIPELDRSNNAGDVTVTIPP